MRGLFARYGFGSKEEAVTEPEDLSAASPRTRSSSADTIMPFDIQSGGKFRLRRPKRRADQLKAFALSALPSRAISVIRNAIGSLTWSIQPQGNLAQDERKAFQKQIDVVRQVLENPNTEDDDYYSWIGQIVEDILTFDAGVWEYVPRPKFIPNNKVLALHAVPGETIARHIKWNGSPLGIRWAQVVEGKKPVGLRDRDIEYVMQRKRAHSAFGFAPLEACVEIMETYLGLTSYQKSVASTAYPSIMLYLGDNTSADQARAMRTYWRTELEGRGRPGIWGNTGEPKVLPMKPAGDEGLYLRFQEMLTRIVAFSFGLKPQDFGMERDVNRSTAETSRQSSIEEARLPLAMLISSKINSRVIPRIAQIVRDPKILQLRHFFIGVDPRDRKNEAEIHDIYLKHDILTIDDVRLELGLPPMENDLGQLTPTMVVELFKVEPTRLVTDANPPVTPQAKRLAAEFLAYRKQQTVPDEIILV